MKGSEIRETFLRFFESRGHKVIPSSSLVPEDPSVLLTTAGMQQFKKYYTGELDSIKDFGTKNTTSVQKSFRTSDIDEVGDESHLTFFEMLGNFSFGGYFKKEAIEYAYQFITQELGLKISYVTIFGGSDNAGVPKDEESKHIWRSLGIKDIREEGMESVFWGPTGTSGPCGPTTEIYCKNRDGKDIEVWNIVFNEFFYKGSREELLSGNSDKRLENLEVPGVDTGMGLERLTMATQGVSTIFETDLFRSLMDLLPRNMDMRTKRIITDHARGIAFLLSDGVRPSNKEAGYVARKLMRRVIAYNVLCEDAFDPLELLKKVCDLYASFYHELSYEAVSREMKTESERFKNTLDQGFKELGKFKIVNAQSAFKLYESFGLPYEIIKEVGGEKTTDLKRKAFDEEFRKHQEISRAGTEKKFGGHGLILDTGELKAGSEEEKKKVTRLHTATHLLQAGLREVLGSEVEQRGSDITPERTRFDFSFGRKLTPEEKQKVQDFINDIIKKDLPVHCKEMSKEDARKTGALFFFKEKYPERVNIYYIGKDLDTAVSKEFCGGPHVTRTGEIGHVTISKEEAVGAGIRRIRAKIDL